MAKKILYDLALSSLLFLILFFLSAVFFSQVLLKSEAVTLPDLAGKTLAQARTELAKKDLTLSHRGTESNDKWEKGLIVRQEPEAGSKIRVTKVVQVLTSAGSENVTVPDLSGKSLAEALTLLQAAGLVKGDLSQVHTSKSPAGRVLDQKPEAGSVVERDSPVGLLLSQGGLDARYIMPDLIERRADRIIERLKALDFNLADIRYVY